jgi:tetratricopeptide (TPR) repeat protein
MMTNRSLVKAFLLLIPAVLPAAAEALPQQSASVADSGAKSPAAAARPKTPIAAHVFAFPVASKSAQAQKLVELALDQYENVLLDKSVESAQKAAEIDPQFALAYAVWSFAARRNAPSPEATRKAELYVSHAPDEEQLLVKFMVSVQKEDMLPAIAAMNDLLARFPEDPHALYLTAEWLYFEQDYDRSTRMMERIIKLDPSFAPAYNMLGYSQVEAGVPDPAKAIGYLKKYAELEHGQPNPEDSLGEVSRYVGDDQGSLFHYRAALQFAPAFITSQTGLGDTYTLMGDFANASLEYGKAISMATNDRDRLHVENQKALMNFWEGKPKDGLLAFAAVEEKAALAHEPYSRFEALEALALLEPTAKARIERLVAMERIYSQAVEGMAQADRNQSLASIWRDQVRILTELNRSDVALQTVHKLENLATKSRDLLVQNCYESARGYVFFAQKDYENAADELSADPHSPLTLKWLAMAREKSGNPKAVEAAKLRLKYLRAPTVEWYLATRAGSTLTN